MKIAIATGVIAALTLSACGAQSKPAPETPQVSSQVSTAAESSTTSTASTSTSGSGVAGPAAAPAKGDKPNRDFVVGKWGTDGDCTLAIDLRSDGTSDGPFGNWTYNDGVLSFPDDPDFKINVTVIDPNTMESTNGSGKTAKMTRCP